MLMATKKVLVSQLLKTVKNNVGNTIVVNLMVSVKLNSLMVTAIGDNGKTVKGKAMEQSTLQAILRPTLGSKKSTNNTATATPSGKVEQFITGNGRKATEKDTDFISGQMEMNTMENGKTTTEQE